MIHYDDIKIGFVYTPTDILYTTNLNIPINCDDWFTILTKEEIPFPSFKRFRFEIILNDVQQILYLSSVSRDSHSKILPLKEAF